MTTPGQAIQSSPLLFFDTMNAHQRTEALKAAIELDVFTAIGEGNQTPAALAKRCKASERGMRILSDYLVVIGFLLKEGNDLGVRSAEKSDYLVVARKQVKACGAKGIMKMRTTKPEQLNLAFVDSPQGSQAAEIPNLLGRAKARLHKAKGKESGGFVTGSSERKFVAGGSGLGV